ncbi:hypothetical protein SGRI78S_06658 [Streptomyces griseus subsp. griseus]
MNKPTTPRHHIPHTLQHPEIPATINREPTHRIPTRRHQTPQTLTRNHPTRITAPHTHNHHRITGINNRNPTRNHTRDPTGHPPANTPLNPHQPTHELSQRTHRRIIKNHRRRKPNPEQHTQPITQLNSRQRIKTHLPKRQPHRHIHHRTKTQNRSDLSAYGFHHGLGQL